MELGDKSLTSTSCLQCMVLLERLLCDMWTGITVPYQNR